MSVADLLNDFYSEMKECEEENEMMSMQYLLKQQAQIVDDYEKRITDELIET